VANGRSDAELAVQSSDRLARWIQYLGLIQDRPIERIGEYDQRKPQRENDQDDPDKSSIHPSMSWSAVSASGSAEMRT
jgi:hypothetical protein